MRSIDRIFRKLVSILMLSLVVLGVGREAAAQTPTLFGLDETGKLFRYNRVTGKADLVRRLDENLVGPGGGCNTYFSALGYENGKFYTTCKNTSEAGGRLVKFSYTPGDETGTLMLWGGSTPIVRLGSITKIPGDPTGKFMIVGDFQGSQYQVAYMNFATADWWASGSPSNTYNSLCTDSYSQAVYTGYNPVLWNQAVADNSGRLHLALHGGFFDGSIALPNSSSTCIKADCTLGFTGAPISAEAGMAFDAATGEIFGINLDGRLSVRKILPINPATYCTGTSGAHKVPATGNVAPKFIGPAVTVGVMRGMVLAPDYFPGHEEPGVPPEVDTCDYYRIEKAMVCL